MAQISFTAEAEELARLFVAKWPTRNAQRAIAAAEAGQVTWEQVATIFAKAWGTATSPGLALAAEQAWAAAAR